MSSDPFKLVTDRRFDELRQEAHRDRIIRESLTRSESGRRHSLLTFIRARLRVPVGKFVRSNRRSVATDPMAEAARVVKA